jgi:hypothetical protein
MHWAGWLTGVVERHQNHAWADSKHALSTAKAEANSGAHVDG